MFSELMDRVRATITGADSSRDIEDERAFHIDMASKRNERRGMSPEVARRQALLTYGGADRFDEEIHDVHRIRWFEDFVRDTRLSLRMLMASPSFALAAILTLATGIGANAAIFSVMNSVLLRPLPYTRPDELVSFKPETYARYAAMSKASSLRLAGAYTNESANVSTTTEPVRSWVLSVTSTVLPTIGVRPYLGHNFTAADDARGGSPHVMLRYGFWKEYFGGDRSIVGRVIELDGVGHEVIGVLPESLEFPAPARGNDGSMPRTADVWTGAGTLDDLTERGGFHAIGRLAPGVSVARAQSEIASLAASNADDGLPPAKISVVSVVESVTAPVRPALLVFMASVALVLLVACANLGSLLLAKLAGRTREIAVRSALGASGGRIVRQIVTECIVVSALGGVCAMLFAWGLLRWMLHTAPPDLPRLHTSHIDSTVMLYTVGLSMITAVIIALLPAWSVKRHQREALVGGPRGAVTDRGTTRAHRVLVASDVAFAVILLVGASLLLRSYQSLMHVSPGFRTEGLITADVHLSADRYKTREDVLQFFSRAEARIAALPGVSAVSAIDRLPYGPSWSRVPLGIEGQPEDTRDAPSAFNAAARPGYFDAIGIPILKGREFSDLDVRDAPPVVILSKATADKYWPGGGALGAHVRVFGTPRTVVGIAGDVRHFGPTTPVDPMVYLPQAQDAATRRGMTFVVRTMSADGEAMRKLRDVLRETDGTLPVSNVRSFDDLRAKRTAGQRFSAQLVSTFALIAALLAGVGIYGVMSFAVSQRRREIGVRMALGAARGEVLTSFLRRAMLDAAPGALIGAAVAIPLTGLARKLLYGVTPGDPASFVAALAFVFVLSLVAAAVPARRAAAIDPGRALVE